MTVREILAWSSDYLTKQNSPYLDSLLIASYILNIPKEKLMAMLPDPFPEEHVEQYKNLIQKRKKGTPIAYITGSREFWGMDFQVGPGVLIPRPDTEILVERAISIIKDPVLFDGAVLDLCTGSGCIACALAKEMPKAHITASDNSDEALEYAKRNINRHAPQVSVIKSDLFSDIPQMFDMIVTNPPYIADNEYSSLQIEVQREPVSALVSGEDGLECIRQIIYTGVERLRPYGYLCIEAAPRQAESIGKIMKASGFEEITYSNDLSGRKRVTSGQKRI